MNRAIPFVCGVLTIGLLLAFMHRDYPSVGFDFAEYVPRFIDTDLHIRINGMGPQWYTPTFGTGLPAFPNPQHYQYSVIQLLFLVTGPWTAILLSTALAAAVGFAAFYLFLREQLNLSTVSSTLGAIGLIANGYYMQHMPAGQLPFQLFPMAGVFLYAATSPRFSILAAAAVCGLTAAAIVHAGGGLLVVFLAGSLLIALQAARLLNPSVLNLRRICVIGVTTAGLALAMTASKLYAVRAFMTHFPRELSDQYETGFAHALFGLATQLAGGMMIIPVLFAGGFPTQRLDDALMRSTGAGVHATELDNGVLPVLSIGLAIALARVAWRAVGRGRVVVKGARAVEIALLALTVWLAIETTLAIGVIYPALHQLPFFRSMHVNHRIAGVFILPITIAGAGAVNTWRGHARPAAAAGLLIAALAFQSSYFLLPELFFWRWFDITQSVTDHAQVRAGERFLITRVDDVLEPNAFKDRVTTKAPYEPLFGYDNENFKADTQEGPVDQVRDGRFNMTNAASLVFPELNGLRPFERIRTDDRANLERFVNRLQPDWKRPAILDWLNALAVATLVLCLGILGRASLSQTAHSRRSRPKL